MTSRLTAAAQLAGQLGSLTVSIGGLLVRPATLRDKGAVLEDDF
ncbi:MAG: hypothetical protein R2687_06810 [Candidatus Nanopelagicales bacterium]|jgi:hypothetical protein